jgi:hypothetical protein
MKLKRYLQFIKESLKEDLESGKIWELDEDQIREYLIELDDAGYLITVNFGFVKKHTIHRYNKPSIEKDVYTENIVAGEEIKPAYNIVIEKSRDLSGEDVSDAFKFACSIISDEGDCDISIHDSEGGLGDIEGIQIKGGFFYTDNWNSSKPELLEAEDHIAIFAKQRNTIKIKPQDLEDYYGWDVSVKKDGQLWAEIDLEDLADFILSPRSEYKDSLVKGQEYMWDYYDISAYYPDIISLFGYSVEKDNQVLLVKSIIKELGGYEQAINHIGDECDNQIYEEVKDMKEEELIKYLLSERFYKTIKQLATDSEVLQEIRGTIANWEMSAHCDDNYDQIVSSFDRIVSDELGQFEKVEKEVRKYYTSKDAQGNQTRKEYKTDVTYYQFPYSNDWISDVDSEYLFNKELDDLFRDFVRESDIDRKLNPRISDYGDVNKEEMNKDIKAYLTRYLFE